MKYTYDNQPIPPEFCTSPSLAQFHPAMLQIFANRGFVRADEVEDFLFCEDSVLLRQGLADTDRAVDELKRAIEHGDKIVIYRDYDCDGCCAGAVAMLCLAHLGATVTHYANERTVDGYGLCVNGIDQILALHPDVRMILTVDNGIVAYEGIEHAKNLGLRVVVTDHHATGETLPPADAVVNPKRSDEQYPFRDLCGAGVIFKVMLALFSDMGRPADFVLSTLDIVAVATVGDVVPMFGENRVIVRRGIDQISSGSRPFFHVLLEQFKVREVRSVGTLGFLFAPILNAASRMGLSTDLGVEGLMSTELSHAKSLCDQLVSANNERKKITESSYRTAKKAVASTPLPSAIVLCEPTLSDGIIGIIAGKLKQEFHRISVVFTQHDPQTLKGSARGVDGFHLKEGLDRLNPDYFISYGGHAKAAGITLKAEYFEDFCTDFLALVEKSLDDSDYVAQRVIDLVLTEGDCSVEFLQSLQQLEPFGEGFPPVRYGLTAETKSVNFMGANGQHVKYQAENISVIQWNNAENARKLEGRLPRKFVGTLQLNEFRGEKSVQFICEK